MGREKEGGSENKMRKEGRNLKIEERDGEDKGRKNEWTDG